MQTFRYRLPRFATNFPVSFEIGEMAVPGRCINLSEAGLRGVFQQGLPVGTAGLMTLHSAPWQVEIGARVAYASATQMVVRFTFGSPYEQAKLRQFVMTFAN